MSWLLICMAFPNLKIVRRNNFGWTSLNFLQTCLIWKRARCTNGLGFPLIRSIFFFWIVANIMVYTMWSSWTCFQQSRDRSPHEQRLLKKKNQFLLSSSPLFPIWTAETISKGTRHSFLSTSTVSHLCYSLFALRTLSTASFQSNPLSITSQLVHRMLRWDEDEALCHLGFPSSARFCLGIHQKSY